MNRFEPAYDKADILERLPEHIIGNLSETAISVHYKDRFYLPKGAFTVVEGAYILTGRYIGRERGGTTAPILVQGHPIDIMAHYILLKDFFSESSSGSITNNFGSNRMLIAPSEFNRVGESDKHLLWFPVRLEYKDGLIRPSSELMFTKIAPSEYDCVDGLKHKQGFGKSAEQYLSKDSAKELTDYLFQ